jgi:hypothetical protein
MRASEFVREVNYPDELTVSDRIQQYFIQRGYKLIGEGRDQMAFLSPRQTVVKILGTGESEREDIVKRYVDFFVRNQRNPYYPKIYNSGEFTVDGETYFLYEMEYLPNYLSNDDDILDYIEKLMSAIDRDRVGEFQDKNKIPAGLNPDEITGLIMATDELVAALGGWAPLDLSNVENLARRADGHIVILDPFSL